jgi:AcrR family transcriptional regulator
MHASLPRPNAIPGHRASRRADARRMEILRAAARVFRDRGFDGAGMREIAAEADLSPGILYHYFAGKHEILYFCQDRSLDRMLAAVAAARASAAPAAARLRAILVSHVHCLLDEVEGSVAHLAVEALPNDRRARIVAKRDRYERAIRSLIAEGIARRELAPSADPTLVTRAILGALNWSARWFRPGGPRDATAVAAELANYLVNGLDAPSPRKPRKNPRIR